MQTQLTHAVSPASDHNRGGGFSVPSDPVMREFVVHPHPGMAEAVVAWAIEALGKCPKSVLLPYAGCGLYIEPLLRHGVKEVIAVDTATRGIKEVQKRFGGGSRVMCEEADFSAWDPDGHSVDAVFWCGMSFGALVNHEQRAQAVERALRPLKRCGAFLLTDLGRELLGQARNGTSRNGAKEGASSTNSTVVASSLNGMEVQIHYTPSVNGRVLTLQTEVCSKNGGDTPLWNETRPHLVCSREELTTFFNGMDAVIRPCGLLHQEIPALRQHRPLPPYARATMWVWRKFASASR